MRNKNYLHIVERRCAEGDYCAWQESIQARRHSRMAVADDVQDEGTRRLGTRVNFHPTGRVRSCWRWPPNLVVGFGCILPYSR